MQRQYFIYIYMYFIIGLHNQQVFQFDYICIFFKMYKRCDWYLWKVVFTCFCIFFYILKLFHFVRFIIIPSQDFQSQANTCEDVSKKGIGGARKTILNFPFLMNYHNTSSTLKVLAAGLLLFLYSRFYVVVAGLINYPIQWVKDWYQPFLSYISFQHYR